MTTQVSSADRCDDKALAPFAACERWQRGRTKHGRSFFAIPGGEAGLFHMADRRAPTSSGHETSASMF